MILFTLGGILAPEEMMKSFGMSYTKEAAVILPFALMGQIFYNFNIYKFQTGLKLLKYQ